MSIDPFSDDVGCDPVLRAVTADPRGTGTMELGLSTAVPPASLMDALPDAVVVADASGRVTYANPALRRLLGHDPLAVVGRPLRGVLPHRYRARQAGAD